MSGGARHFEGRFDVAIVGSGFAGSILARVLARRGLATLLVERGRHPRFALGESSTPLAALALERLAARWELPDLYYLAAYGRWLRELPELRRGLKRGFTFYRHHAGERFANSPANEARLLVAASPNDAVADSHWLRSDVDHHLLRQAIAAGVTYRDETELDALEQTSAGFRLSGTAAGRRVAYLAARIVDGSGRGGFLARHLGLEHRPPAFTSSLVYGHFAGRGSFFEAARADGAAIDPGPYPDERAAVHHLLDGGWLYVLPFDHGVASCGLIRLGDGARDEPPETGWHRTLERYPTLWRTFAAARPLAPLGDLPRLQHRVHPAAGDGWYLLPHAAAFYEPMFSTGIAWSLLAVERLAEVLTGEADPATAAYGALLEREADQIESLIAAAYLALGDFRLFTAVSLLYFAAVSYSECEQRLRPDLPRPAWQPFLRADDPLLGPLPGAAVERLRRLGEPTAAAVDAFTAWVSTAIAPRDIAGFTDPARHNLHPLDLDLLVARAGLLGLTPAEVRAALPWLRGVDGRRVNQPEGRG